MKNKLLLRILPLLLFAPLLLAAPGTMRLDYYHTGNDRQEMFSMDRVVVEPLPWPGNPAKNIDQSDLGNYRFEVRDRASGELLYSRGFNSVYGEWVTTDEAKKVNRTFSESLRFPAPSLPVRVVLKKREAGNFTEIWTTTIDPKDKFIDSSHPPSPGPLLTIQKTGEPANKVDLLVLGDGYTAAERGKFEKDARHFADMLFAIPPFREHRQDFNVWGLCPAAEESGVSRPSSGVHRRNPLGTAYDTFDTERYVLTLDNRALRDIASYAPYEFIEILVNSETYGGGGIFNLYATVAIDNLWAPYVGVHEFGHHFAALADEYFTSEVAYLPATKRMEPWEPNVTALLDAKDLKWKDLVSSGTPIPTPWRKQEFEALEKEIQKRRKEIRAANLPESEMNRLLQEEEKREEALLSGEKYAGKVGAFEGANYEVHGYYRPEINCIMFTRHQTFCAVCRGGIEKIIGMYAGQ
jgi:IgA Peptidase M64/Peptidase M64 N-terminus